MTSHCSSETELNCRLSETVKVHVRFVRQCGDSFGSCCRSDEIRRERRGRKQPTRRRKLCDGG